MLIESKTRSNWNDWVHCSKHVAFGRAITNLITYLQISFFQRRSRAREERLRRKEEELAQKGKKKSLKIVCQNWQKLFATGFVHLKLTIVFRENKRKSTQSTVQVSKITILICSFSQLNLNSIEVIKWRDYFKRQGAKSGHFFHSFCFSRKSPEILARSNLV